MKRIAALYLAICIIVICMPYAAAQTAADASFESRLHLTYSEGRLVPGADDEFVKDTLFYYADHMGTVSYNQVIAHLEDLGMEYEGEIGENTLAVLNVHLIDGRLYFCFYPLDTSDTSTDFGDPDKEMLSCVEYSRDDKWITVTDEFHIGDVIYRAGDKSSEPIAHYMSSITSILEFYNSNIGGFITFGEENAK